MTKYKYNENVFYNEDDISYYLLGAFMTDGCVQTNGKFSWISSISSKDEDWIINMRNIICPELKICQGNKVKLINICSKNIGEWFISKGCVPKKSAILKFPNVPDKFMADFLRGVFDGDGSLSLYKNKKNNKNMTRSYILTISYDFAKSIHDYLSSINIKNSLNAINKPPTKIGDRIVIAKHIQYRVNLGNKSTCKLLQFMYYDNHKISLPRKSQLANKTIKAMLE